MRRLIFALMLMPSVALAQQQQARPALASVDLAYRQMALSISALVEDMNREIAARDARVAELEKLCGEPCKPKADAPK